MSYRGNKIKKVTDDSQIKDSDGELYLIHVSMAGVTEGDLIAVRNGPLATSDVVLRIVAPTDNCNELITFGPNGAHFPDGIFISCTLTSGNVTVTCIYD